MSREGKETEEKREGKVSRQTYFYIGICGIWKREDTIRITLKKLRKKYNLKWLKLSMSNHGFSNLRKGFQGDLSGKLTRKN